MRLIVQDTNPATGRLRALRQRWDMNADEIAGCFGAERRSYQRWEKAEGAQHLQEAGGANGAVDVLLRHYEAGGDTPHSCVMKWVQRVRTGCEQFGPVPGEIEWRWRFVEASKRNTPHETVVHLPNILIPMRWGIKWAILREAHLRRLLARTGNDADLDAEIRALIDHYRAVIAGYDTAVADQMDAATGEDDGGNEDDDEET